MLTMPICVPMFLTTDNLENGSIIKFEMDSKGKNWPIIAAVSPSGKNLKFKNPFIIFSKTYQTKRNPSAKADRFTSIPKKRQKEKNPTNFTKKARR